MDTGEHKCLPYYHQYRRSRRVLAILPLVWTQRNKIDIGANGIAGGLAIVAAGGKASGLAIEAAGHIAGRLATVAAGGIAAVL